MHRHRMTWFKDPSLEQYQERIRLHQGVQLVRMMPFLILGNWIVSALTLLNARGAVLTSGAWVPLSIGALLVLPIFLSWRRLKDAPLPEHVSARRIRRADIHSALLGFCWAATCLMLFPEMTAVQQALHSGFISALMMGAAASISFLPYSGFFYAGQMLIGLIVATLLFDKSGVYIFVITSVALGWAALFVQRLSWNNFIDYVKQSENYQALLAEQLKVQKRASSAKTDFLANTSHELRTPLNAIIGYSEIMLDEAEGNGHEGYVSDLRKIRSAGRHILALINDILDLSKIEAGKMELLPEQVKLEDLIGDVNAVVRNLVTKNGNTFDIDNAAGSMQLWIDVTKVRQIVLNLLSNAGKFTQNGAVTLHIERFERQGQDWLRFRVTDTGPGIPADKLDAVFNEYDRGDAGTARRYGGTGLGLSLSRKIARLCGGDITVRSEIGAGSSFEFTMPARVEKAAEAA